MITPSIDIIIDKVTDLIIKCKNVEIILDKEDDMPDKVCALLYDFLDDVEVNLGVISNEAKYIKTGRSETDDNTSYFNFSRGDGNPME